MKTTRGASRKLAQSVRGLKIRRFSQSNSFKVVAPTLWATHRWLILPGAKREGEADSGLQSIAHLNCDGCNYFGMGSDGFEVELADSA